MIRPRVPARYVVLVTGSRDWTDEAAIRRRLERYPEGTLVIHGGCEGADCIAHHVAIEFGMRILGETYFGDLGRHGGPARNDLLIDLALVYVAHGYTVCVEAFPSSTARGTWDTVNKARNAGLPYEVTRK